jgi:FtsP/CotA-like multicopper oxidase with cupredoxin domain
MNRRDVLKLGGGLVAASALAAPGPAKRLSPNGPLAVLSPNGATLEWKTVGGVKVGQLVAAPLQHTFAPGLEAEVWGYNGRTPGPLIEATEGDKVRLYVTNKLPESTSVHWHGILLPNGMDGVGGLTQRPIAPGQTYRYEFTFTKPGTFLYHPHYDEMTQIALGMAGMIVVHPRTPRGPKVDRDFALLSHEWKVVPGMRRPDPSAMTDFNVFTFNGKSFPATDPLVVGRGERVRLRLGNLSPMDHHPIHIHGHAFKVTATDGGDIAEPSQWPETTVLVPVGSTRTVEFVADAPGDWPLHCHMTHHVMTQMGHNAAVTVGADADRIDKAVQPAVSGYMTMGQDGMAQMAEMGMDAPANSIPMRGSPGPFGVIDMGGMFTLVKVRERGDSTEWYGGDEKLRARQATPAELEADGIKT